MDARQLRDALHDLAGALRVAGTDEAAQQVASEFLEGMDADVRALISHGDFEWMDELIRHCYATGYHSGLRKASELAGRALERAA